MRQGERKRKPAGDTPARIEARGPKREADQLVRGVMGRFETLPGVQLA
jgi:hypothetical protein